MQSSWLGASLRVAASTCIVGYCLGSGLAFAGPKKQEVRTFVTRQGDYAVKQLVSPDFEALPLERKLFAYYLSLAVSAGRDITWIQDARGGLRLRLLLEKVWENSELISPTQKAALEEYFFRVLMNHGNYEEKQNQKFVPEKFTEADFRVMVSTAELSALKKGRPISIQREAEELRRAIFDKTYRPAYLAAAPAELLADSNTDYYGEGVTQYQLEEMPPAQRDHFLSYPRRGAFGKLELQLHRIGDRFDRQLRAVDTYFEEAKKYASPEERIIISAFQKAIHSGNPEDELAAETLWVKHKSNDLDFVIGFKEVYNDPLGKRGAWEGFILLKTQNQKTTDRVSAIRGNNDYFEANMPVAPEFKKAPGFTPPHAEGAYLLFTGGANGETPFAGVNLPNDPRIRELHGSKSFTAINVMNPVGPKDESENALIYKTFYLPKYFDSLSSWDDGLAYDIQVEFHEILGHGSGKNHDGITDLDLKEYYNPLEEARAETASLFHMLDPKLREFRIVDFNSDEEFFEFGKMEILRFFTAQLRSYAKLSDRSTEFRQAHQWGRQVMLEWLLKSGAISVRLDSNKVPKVDLSSLDEVRSSLGALWAEIQETKGTGNYERAKELFQTYGAYTQKHKTWRKGIVAATDQLGLPKESVFLNPRLVLRKNRQGVAQDVQLRYTRGEGLGVFIRAQLDMTRESDRLIECANLLKP